MPNAKVLSEKQAVVEALVERINAASAGILVDYQGITVAEDTALRTEMRKEGVDYSVVKNTLTRIAIDKVGMNELDPVLNGSTSMATSSEDPIAPFRIISDYSKKLGDKFNIKAAFMEGKILSEQEIAELSTLTSKNDLYSKLAGSLNAIMGGLAVALSEVVEQKGGAGGCPHGGAHRRHQTLKFGGNYNGKRKNHRHDRRDQGSFRSRAQGAR